MELQKKDGAGEKILWQRRMDKSWSGSEDGVAGAMWQQGRFSSSGSEHLVAEKISKERGCSNKEDPMAEKVHLHGRFLA